MSRRFMNVCQKTKLDTNSFSAKKLLSRVSITSHFVLSYITAYRNQQPIPKLRILIVFDEKINFK